MSLDGLRYRQILQKLLLAPRHISSGVRETTVTAKMRLHPTYTLDEAGTLYSTRVKTTGGYPPQNQALTGPILLRACQSSWLSTSGFFGEGAQ